MKLVFSLILVLTTIASIYVSPSKSLSGIEPGDFEDSESHPENKRLPDNRLPRPSVPILNSFDNATFWAANEEVILNTLKLRQKRLQHEIRILERLIVDQGAATLESNAQSKSRLNKSIQGYLYLLQQLKKVLMNKFMDLELRGMMHRDWPSEMDLEFAMNSLIHIQKVYNFDYNKLPNELSPETTKPPQLTSSHISEIGMHALYREHFSMAVEWMQHALEKAKKEPNSNIYLTQIRSDLDLAIHMQREALLAEENTNYLKTTNTFHNIFERSVSPFLPKDEGTKEEASDVCDIRNSKEEAVANYNAICSGKDLRSTKQLSALYCWFDTNSSPARRILPYKKELLSVEPKVIQVYDILGDQLISSLLRNKKKCSWMAATIGKGKTQSFAEKMRARTPSNCWPDIPHKGSLWKKISSVTLTDLEEDESHTPFQTLSYLFGRLHFVHRDALQLTVGGTAIQDTLRKNGDRIISIIFYLNDVAAGGATAFPTAGTAAVPAKGSLIYWNNIYMNGSARLDTWHGGCPVLYGHKEAATVHIHSNSQFRTYPCTLSPIQ